MLRSIFFILIFNLFLFTHWLIARENDPTIIAELFKSQTLQTGTCSGRVVDAETGKPIEGAVVVYHWEVGTFLIERMTRPGPMFETLTDRDGRYFVPNQEIRTSEGVISNLEPEEVYIYKQGYVRYRVYDWKVDPFLVYLPDLKQTYRKKNNLVRLQPWNDKFSHAEHIMYRFRTDDTSFPKLHQALAKEIELAEKEKQARNEQQEKSREVYKKLKEDRQAFRWKKITREEYMSRMSEYMNFPDAKIISQAARALNLLDDKSGVDILIRFLKQNIYRKRNFEICISSINAITGREDLDGTPIISERLEMLQELEQWWSRVKDLSKPEWFADLLLNSKNHRSRGEAINILSHQIGDSTVAPYLVKALHREGDRVDIYQHILIMLAKFGDKSLIPVVKKKLYHENVYIRREAAIALHTFGDPSGVPVMIASLEAPRMNTRSVAVSVLKKITNQNFSETKSLRYLPPDKQKAVIAKLQQWWRENQSVISYDRVNNQVLSEILINEISPLDSSAAFRKKIKQDKLNFPIFEDPNDSPIVIFEIFKQAVRDGDIKKALSFLAFRKREEHRRFLEKLGTERQNIIQNMGPLIFDSKRNNVYNYEMLTETDEGVFSFPIYFIRGDKGEWFIEFF